MAVRMQGAPPIAVEANRNLDVGFVEGFKNCNTIVLPASRRIGPLATHFVQGLDISCPARPAPGDKGDYTHERKRFLYMTDAEIPEYVNDTPGVAGVTAWHQLLELEESGVPLHLAQERAYTLLESHFVIAAPIARLRELQEGLQLTRPTSTLATEYGGAALRYLEAAGYYDVPLWVVRHDAEMKPIAYPDKAQGAVVIYGTGVTCKRAGMAEVHRLGPVGMVALHNTLPVMSTQ